MKIINGKNAIAGRLASYVAKQALQGEEIKIVNCDKAIITGNRKNIKENFQKMREKIGSGQKGPKISKNPEKIIKRMIRGMLPTHRLGRGREAFKKIKCYSGIPSELENEKMISAGKEKGNKFIEAREIFEK